MTSNHAREISRIASDAAALYAESIIIDGAVPVMMQDISDWRRYFDAGVTAILATVTSIDGSPATIGRLTRMLELIERNPNELLLAESSADIHRAKREGRLAIVLAFQNATPLDRDAGMVAVYKRLGVGVIQLCYNYRNDLGDGSLEAENAGLSAFGRKAVRAMNKHRVVIDLSHTGERTALEALDHSERIDIVSHANARAVFDHPRNISDRQIRRVAEKGGVIGLCCYQAFITDTTAVPNLGHVMEHLDHMVHIAGIDHVSLGTDFFHDTGYALNIELGYWSAADYAAPPWHFPLDGTNSVELAEAMNAKGYTDDDIRKVLGGNLLQSLTAVWDA